MTTTLQSPQPTGSVQTSTPHAKELGSLPQSDLTFKNIWEQESIEEETLPTPFSLFVEDEEQERPPLFFSHSKEEEETPEECPIEQLRIYPLAPLTGVASLSQGQVLGCSPVLSVSLDTQILFEKMAGTMLILHHSGVSETTFILNAPQFSASALFGSQITIKEYSSAPKAYNIFLSATPPAVHLFNTQLPQLMLAFEKGNFPFTVHRVETQIDSAERPLFHRKETDSNLDQEGQENP